MVQNILELIGRVFFSRTRVKTLEAQLNTAGVDLPAEAFGGFLTLFILLLAVAVAALLLDNGVLYRTLQPWTGGYDALATVATCLVSLVVSYFAVTLVVSSFLILKTDARRNALETALPDFLTLVSSNIKAGMPLDQGMWYAAKPEFGLLSREVQSIVKRSFGGESLESALDLLARRFDSKLFARTITLIKQASATGGEVSEVLETTARDARNTNLMKKEVAASLVLYEIFVLFAGMVGTPFLFAVAAKLVKIFEFRNFGVSSIPTTSILGRTASVNISQPVITANEFFYFSMGTIFVTVLFSSFIVGVIRKGNKNEGIKYFPVVLAVAYLLYFLTDTLLSGFFTTFSR